MKRVTSCLLHSLLAASLFLFAAAAAAADSNLHKVVNGVSIYLGVFPAEMILGQPRPRAEAQMHGGVPAGEHRYHVTVALFDNAAGKRITGAQVKASVPEIGLSGVQKKLEHMLIAGAVSYGNYFAMAATSNPYRIQVRIELPGVADVIEAQFDYQHARA
jgi:hypothetical protein